MKIEIEQATKLRGEFANYLGKMSDTIRGAENLFVAQYANQSALNPYIKELDQKKNQLMSGKFTFLVLGDFNRGKSTFLNVLLGQNVLPTKAIACTAIPTFVKYGREVQLQVYFKDGRKTNPMNLKEFKEKYTLSSDSIKTQIRKGALSIENFIRPIDYAVLECPSPLLGKPVNGRIENQVEFIDSAGLNHSEEENVRTLSYAKSCDAVILLLSAEQQLSQVEKEYLEVKIKGNVSTIFFLINKWDLIPKSNDDDEDDNPEEEIRDAFITGLSNSLRITEEQVKEMWGKRIFEISAQSALTKLNKNETLDNTGFPEFTNSLNYFLVNQKLKVELEDTHTKAKATCFKIKELVDFKIKLNRESLDVIEKKIRDAEPCFNAMKSIANQLKNEVLSTKNSCSKEVSDSYKEFFAQVIKNFEFDFISQEFDKLDIDNLKEEKRDEFRKKIEELFVDYVSKKDEEWNKNNQNKVKVTIMELNQKFNQKIKIYNNHREQTKSVITRTEEKKIQQNIKTEAGQIESNKQLDMTTYNAYAPQMVFAGTTMGLGTGMIGTGVAIGLLSLTPPGWVILGAIATVGIIGGFLGYNFEKGDFKERMKKQLQQNLSEMNNDTKVLEIESHIKSLFNSFNNVIDQLNNDTESLENLLNNSKREKEVKVHNFDEDEKRLLALAANIESQYKHLDTEYKKIFP